MNVSANKPTQQATFTPHELLERFKKGERPVVENLKDKMTNELEVLAEQYKQSMSVDVKRNILEKERAILFEELKYPELTLARNYKQIVQATASDKDVKMSEFDDLLRLMNITGLIRDDSLKRNLHPKQISEDNIDTLKNAYLKASEKNTIGLNVKEYIINLLTSYKLDKPELSNKIDNTFKYLKKNTSYPPLKILIDSVNKKQTVDYCLKQLHKNQTIEYFKYFVNEAINIADRKDDRVYRIVNSLLKNEDVPDIMRVAILGAGKFKSDENFNIIKKIALDKNESDIRKREFAIQSTALYLKNKPDEVKEVMTAISKEDSIFAPLGRILLDKTNGNYNGQIDREIKYAGLGPNRTKDFKYWLKKFYVTEDKLSKKKINSLQENTIPFINYLKKLSHKYKYLIIGDNDTITRYMPENIGRRYIQKGAIFNAGSFFDAFDGLGSYEYNLMSTDSIGNSCHSNALAHETAHTIHNMLNESDYNTIEKLYQNAIKNNRVLDYYAATNSHEYFAQGCDAFTSYYKPHSSLIKGGVLGHTIYELIDVDPELYKFIKKILKK